MSTPAEDFRRGVWAEERAEFGRLGEGYRFALPDLGLEFIADRLRRQSHELHAELTVKCSLPGARTFEGVLSVGDLNFSSTRARAERAKYLAGRARDGESDWTGILEEFTQRVLTAERAGSPAVLLRDLPRPAPDDALFVDGFPLLRRHPTILFGDGGSAKSYLSLFIAGRLDQAGIRCGLFDWELAGEDHRDRFERIFGSDMPGVYYARCTRPLVHEGDRLRRIIAEEKLAFVVLDSVAFASDGPPEAAEVCGRYFQALRQLGPVGSLHVAHISKAEGADQRPFGSTFWHNGSRASWFIKQAEASAPDVVTIGLFNRKSNLGPIRRPVGFEITFSEDRTAFRKVDVGDSPDLAGQLPLRYRIESVLRGGALTLVELADELQAKPDSVKKTVERSMGKVFTRTQGPDRVVRIGLLERRPR